MFRVQFVYQLPQHRKALSDLDTFSSSTTTSLLSLKPDSNIQTERRSLTTSFTLVHSTFIVIFNHRNAESSWYMDEPVKMKKRVDQGKLNIIAIFYKVCARDVKKQTCEFGENFWKLTRASSGDQVKMWKECVSNKICLSKTRGRFTQGRS
ncbi:unnamed protein product [Brassica oleracea]